MAGPIHGRNATVLIDSGATAGSAQAVLVPNAKSVTINQTRDRVDSTVFGANSKTTLAGLRDASGDIGAFWSTDGEHYNISDGEARKFYFYLDGTGSSKEYFFGTANFDVNITAAVDAAVEGSLSWSAATPMFRATTAA